MKPCVLLVALVCVAAACASANEPAVQAPSTSTSSVAPVEVSPVEAKATADDLFDQTRLRTFELTLSEPDLAAIDADPAAEEYVEGTLVFDGEEISPVGIRYKGSIGAFVQCLSGPNPFEPSGEKVCTKLSMKVKINWDDPNAEFYGVRRLQFHSQNLDPTQMHERLGYWLYREMGVPAPRSVHARLVVNGEYMGLFALTEQIDGRFTRANFEDGTGNLYKEVWPFDTRGRATASFSFLDGLKTNEDENPSTALIESFAADLLAAAPGERRGVVENWMDAESLIAQLVVDRAIRNDDGPFHWYCDGGACSNHNYYWYEESAAEQVHLIPWDLDNAFENIRSNANPVTPIRDEWNEATNDCEPFSHGRIGIQQRSATCDPLFAAWAEFAENYDATMTELLSGPLSAESIDTVLGEWEAQIADATAEAEELHDDAISVLRWTAAVGRLRDDLASVREQAS